jgi:membrane-bound lytic murein transglycosylase B
MILRTLVALVIAVCACVQTQAQSAPNSFGAFLDALWPDAQAKGITRATFDLAFDGMTPDPRVMPITRRQPEYGTSVGAYVNSFASPARITAGQRKAAEWADTFAAVEKTFGVPRWIILAIWGVETSYGASKDKWDVFRSIASLAYGGYRTPYFRNELLVALRILQEGHVPRDKMLSSWAGAMGQTQFMPTSFFEYAVDFSGDGRRDIWANIPDILGSTGNYLQKGGWVPGLPWGFEVIVPAGFDYRTSRGSFAEWVRLGLRRPDGAALPLEGNGILFFPSGANGPAFLVTDNFMVLKLYNNSDVYALAAGYLADRIRGEGPIRAAWPQDDPQLGREQRMALQRKLAELGYKVRDFEGRIDFDLRDVVREQQVKFGMVPDGHPTATLLDRLGATP